MSTQSRWDVPDIVRRAVKTFGQGAVGAIVATGDIWDGTVWKFAASAGVVSLLNNFVLQAKDVSTEPGE